jgi:hypothetical protein
VQDLAKFALSMIVCASGVGIIVWPIRFSSLLNLIAGPQRELLRGGSLFDVYWPERVKRSRSLRIQIRLLGVICLSIGAMVAFSK